MSNAKVWPMRRLGRGPVTSELVRPFDISLPGLLKHVRILRQAHMVISEEHGRTRQCQLVSGQLEDATRCTETYRRREGRLDQLGNYIERQKETPP